MKHANKSCATVEHICIFLVHTFPVCVLSVQAAGSVGEKGGSSYVVAGQSPPNRTRTSRGQQGSDAVCREQQDTRAGHTDTGGDTCVVLGETLRTRGWYTMRDTWTVRWTFGTQGVKYSVGFLGHKAEQCGEGRLRHRPLKSRLVVVSVGRSWVNGVILVFQNSTFGHHLTEKEGQTAEIDMFLFLLIWIRSL